MKTGFSPQPAKEPPFPSFAQNVKKILQAWLPGGPELQIDTPNSSESLASITQPPTPGLSPAPRAQGPQIHGHSWL